MLKRQRLRGLSKEGLYAFINKDAILWLLGDVIPLTLLRNFAISIGDIITEAGLMLFIITGVKKTVEIKINK